MSWSTERARPRVFAEPQGEHGWRVCRNDAGVSLLDPTIGYIDELGGTYEVRVIGGPTERQFVPTFKDAMDCFERLEALRGETPESTESETPESAESATEESPELEAAESPEQLTYAPKPASAHVGTGRVAAAAWAGLAVGRMG